MEENKDVLNTVQKDLKTQRNNLLGLTNKAEKIQWEKLDQGKE